MGPCAFGNSNAHKLFVDNRRTIVSHNSSQIRQWMLLKLRRHTLMMDGFMKAIVHIMDGKRCFLERPEWKTIPWSTRNEERPIKQSLVDILCDIPGIIERFRAMRKRGPCQDDDMDITRKRLKDQIIKTIDELEQIRCAWALRYPKVCWEIPTGTKTSISLNSTGQPMFSTVLRFSDPSRADDVLYFNVIHLLLSGMSDTLGLSRPEATLLRPHYIRQHQRPRTDADVLPWQGGQLAHALEICQTVDCFFQQDEVGDRAMILFFPLGVVIHYVRHVPWLATWVTDVLGKLEASRGWGIAGHISSSAEEHTTSILSY